MSNEALIVLKSHTLEQARGTGDAVLGVVVYLSSDGLRFGNISCISYSNI